MKKKIKLAIATIALSMCASCQSIRPSFIEQDIAAVDSEDLLQGHFDDEGNWVPNNPGIAMTYRIPDISSGLIFDAASYQVTPTLQIELLEIDTHIPWIDTVVIDAGAGYQRAFVYVGKLWTNIFEITTGGFVGWDFEHQQLSYGIGLTIIRF